MVAHKQKGVALVSVLVTVALIVGLVSTLSYQQTISARRTGQILHTDQAIMYLFAAEAFAKILLNLDSQQNAYDYYSASEPWGQGIENNYDGGSLVSSLIELNGRFNLNNLRRLPNDEEINSGKKDINLSSTWKSCYQSILESTVSTSSENDVKIMIESLEDWLDEDVIERSLGAEDGYYSSVSSLEKSYKTGNNLIVDPRELVLVRGYSSLFTTKNDDEELPAHEFLRQVTALPITNSKVNINTATDLVLSCLESEARLTSEIATRVISKRDESPFTNIDAFYTLLDEEYPVTQETLNQQTQEIETKTIAWNTLIPKNTVTVASEFFMMKTVLTFGVADVTAYSTLQRTPDGGVRVIRRVLDAI